MRLPNAPQGVEGRFALALGSGSARGWSHLGVFQALAEAEVAVHVVCGSSIGALVGAAFASGTLHPLRDWVLSLDALDVARLLDPSLKGGGFIQGERLMGALSKFVPNTEIQDLPVTFACTATDFYSGREVWLDKGPLLEAVRASIALPGLFTPARREGRWLLDGGLTNPVPVSLCRAFGAGTILAVNLNGDIIGRHLVQAKAHEATADPLTQLVERLHPALRDRLQPLLNPFEEERRPPGLLDVLATSLNIMQDSITRSRLAGEPPDLLVVPRLAHIGLLEFHRAAEAIDAGYQATRKLLPDIREALHETLA